MMATTTVTTAVAGVRLQVSLVCVRAPRRVAGGRPRPACAGWTADAAALLTH